MPYSVCEGFITSDTELVTVWHIYIVKKEPNHVWAYEHFLACCETLGIPCVQDSLDRLLAVDCLIANTDRHLNNIGAVRNAVSLEWYGLAELLVNSPYVDEQRRSMLGSAFDRNVDTLHDFADKMTPKQGFAQTTKRLCPHR